MGDGVRGVRWDVHGRYCRGLLLGRLDLRILLGEAEMQTYTCPTYTVNSRHHKLREWGRTSRHGLPLTTHKLPLLKTPNEFGIPPFLLTCCLRSSSILLNVLSTCPSGPEYSNLTNTPPSLTCGERERGRKSCVWASDRRRFSEERSSSCRKRDQ